MASQKPNSQQTPPSSTSSTNGASPDSQNFRIVRKRNRVPLSCAPCRHRKLKCNRHHPCDNCTKRGDTAACSYVPAGSKSKGGMNSVTGTPDDMQNRINRLEGLVLSLMTAGGQQGATAAAQATIGSSRGNGMDNMSEPGPEIESSDVIYENRHAVDGEESEVEQVSRGIGIMKMNDGKAMFASDAHWYAILGEITEVKRYFEAHKEDYRAHIAKVRASRFNESPGTALFLQGSTPTNHAELLQAFPAKADADRLIARYFDAYDPSVHIIHAPSFQKQYDRHWTTPRESSVAWLGLCFAMMTLALQSYHRSGDEPPEYHGSTVRLARDFGQMTAQCLQLADITQSIPQILETMLLHTQAEYSRSRDAEAGVLLLMSLCVRLAMRMGYHRDPAPHPQISPFAGEMRRRVFAFVRMCDLLTSFQFGLPAMIRHDQTDCRLPANVFDNELEEDMKALPLSRPHSESTPASYMIAKCNMTFIFGRIVERVGSVADPPTYDETMKFDQELRSARATHPPLLQMRSFQESARDPASIIMQRLGLEMVYLRSLFALHRKFIAKGRENPRFAYSRKTCIDASMELLAHQATLHQETQPGGRLRSVKWHVSSLTTHDFLLAAMLVCLDLYHTAEAERRGRNPNSPMEAMADDPSRERREEMLTAVEHCTAILEDSRENSLEAFKASAALRVMVDKLKTHRRKQPLRQTASDTQPGAPQQSYRGHPTFGMFPNGGFNDVNADDLPPEQSAAMTLGMLSSGGVSPTPNFSMYSNPQQTSTGPQPNSANLGPTATATLYDRSGLTPQYSGQDSSGQNFAGAASPFSTLVGQSSNFMTMDGVSGDLDWSAWDNYIANNGAMDSGDMWPMNLDLDAMATTGQQMQSNMGATNSGSFMDAMPPDLSGGIT